MVSGSVVGGGVVSGSVVGGGVGDLIGVPPLESSTHDDIFNQLNLRSQHSSIVPYKSVVTSEGCPPQGFVVPSQSFTQTILV